MDDKISLFGHGFIGSRYDEMFPGAQIICRECISCIHPKILNFRSTIHNYHPIDDDPYIDIETNLLEFMELVKRAKLTFREEAEINQISSWFCLGNTTVPANEDAYCNPSGFYSITKRASEQLLMSYCQTFNMKYRILRLANVIGIGDSKVSVRKNALQYLVKCIVKGESIKIYKDDVIRDYIWVDDVCRAIHLAITEGELNTIYHLGNGVPQSLHNLLDYVIERTQYDKSKIEWVDTPEFHKIVQVKVMYMDNQKISRLGYKPSKSIYSVLDELIEYYERN